MARAPEAVLAVRGADAALYVLSLFVEAGVPVRSVGGNRVRVPADWQEQLPAGLADDVAASLRTSAPIPPGSEDGTVGPAPAEETQPAPDTAHEDEEPATEPASPDTASGPAAPPRSGAGSGRDAWAAYADALGVEYPADAGRDDIIQLTEEHT